ncbi:MAG TPA: HAMP domain-containing methyl-accepting chemotaxis protein [Kofleriaceae bacterium]|nr:HAMP domain-containing methyl-accepting chemotaxis protein [Kofleriaceae bacterium]
MNRKSLRFPMFFKFLVGCLVLAGLLIAGGTWFVRDATRLRSQGNFLMKHMRRYHGYEDRVGRAMTATAEMLAGDAELAAALGPPPPPPAAPEAAGAAAVPPPPPELKTLAKAMHDRLGSKYGLNPDLFVIFTANGALAWAPSGSPVGADDLAELAAVEKARAGNLFAHRVQLVDGNAFQVSAVPIKRGETVVGGLLLGVKVQRYFEEYAEQSDDNADLRLRVTLLQGTKVLASAVASDRWPELGKAMQPDKFVRMKVGDDVRDVLRMRDGDIDFYFEELEGYKGLDSTVIGQLFITRSRRAVNDPGARIPWLQIGVGIGLSLVIASLMAYWITRPIKQMVRQSRDLLAGETDLTQRIVVDSRDETGDLADNINQVFQRVHGLATEVQSAAFQVGASSAEISAASKQTLGGLKEQTSKIGGSTAAVTELSASIQQVASNAAQATEVAEQTNTAIGSAVQRMEQIRRSVDDAADKMRDLGESSKRIGNIVEVIRQISEQTSMLALNASIEAAHAGEQGRGFAVVADEVSSLARRVGQSAKDIEALIQTIKEQTQAAMASMDVGTRDVDTGSQLVTSTLTGLGQLITVVKDTAHAVQEQAVVSDEIARNMDTVQHIATEVLTGSEESVVQAERLHELAYQLEQSIGGFNLDGSRVGAARQDERRQLLHKEAKQLPPRVKREG